MVKRSFFVLFLLLPCLVFTTEAFCGSNLDYPEIRILSRDDMLFIQLQDDVESYYRLSHERQGAKNPPLGLFIYRRKPSDDLFSLNARLNLPYDSIATLNGIEYPDRATRLDRVLIANQPGIFIHDPPRTELEQMMLGSRIERGMTPEKLVVWRDGARENYSFFRGSQFSDLERAYFLRILFRFPIVAGTVTSRYGPRRDPFSGNREFHSGIDIGAPIGTDVHAAREGTVTDVGNNPVLGTYMVLTHPGGCQTVYGHLSAINATLGQKVRSADVIAKVGQSGLATGPHLHFEVRLHGESTDPYPLLRAKR
jgi:murein DD-endopeptidase MepM/ murein hydrolase activator NlpD